MPGDKDAEKWIKIFTLLDKETIDNLTQQHQQNAAARILQKNLAKEVTIFVHGETAYQQALHETQLFFSKQNGPVEEITVEELESIQGITRYSIAMERLQTGVDIITLTADAGVFPSRGEARKMIQNGGLSINKKKVADIAEVVTAERLLHGKYLLIKKGKSFYLFTAQ